MSIDQDSPVVSHKGKKKKQVVHPAYATAGVLFTGTNAVKFLQMLKLDCLEHCCLLITDLTNLYHVELVNQRWMNLVPLLLRTSYCDFYGTHFPV